MLHQDPPAPAIVRTTAAAVMRAVRLYLLALDDGGIVSPTDFFHAPDATILELEHVSINI